MPRMSVHSAYSRPLDTMRYFHRRHQANLESMLAQCSACSSPRHLARLASALRSFSNELHGHHSIEDAAVFPFLSSRTDIRHLHAHHMQLDPALDTLTSLAARLLKVKDMADYDAEEARVTVQKVQALVVEHETAEEAVLDPNNLAKIMSVDDVRRLL